MVSHPTMKNCKSTTGIRNRLLRGQGRSFQVIEAPRGCPFGGGAGHRNGGIGTSRNYWICAIFYEKSSQYFSQHSWATTRNASAPAAVASLWSDNSREGNTTPSQSAGAFWGGQALSLPITGDSQFVEILGFQKSHDS